MSWDPDLLELMPHTVTISTRSSHNNYGEATFSTAATSYRARVVMGPAFMRGKSGEYVEVAGSVWVNSTGTIDISDRITLPDGTRPPIVTVNRVPDEDGTFHHKIILGYAKEDAG